MATNNFTPGGGKFASGNKFKGRAFSGGDSSNNRSSRDARPNRESRGATGDRPDRAGKFGDKKVFNRSERFTRSGEEGAARSNSERPRAFERSSFKSGPRFSKPSPFKGSKPSEAGSEERAGRRERTGRDENAGRSEDTRGGGRYAARGERKPYGEKPYQKSFNSEDRRPAKPFNSEDRRSAKPFNSEDRRPAKPAYGGNREDTGERSRDSREENAPRAASKSYDRAKPAAGRNSRRDFRAKTEEPAEAPSYDLKRFQARERRQNDQEEKGLIRLNRYIANAGICSRREADTLIAAGEIKVNGEVVTEMGYTVRPEDTVTYGKKRLNREKMVYVLLNKPKDFITTTEDPEGRKTVMDLVGKASKERIFPVGRLDRNTTGLLLFTNDGELAHKLTHPSNNISKIYQVELDKPITRDHFEQIVNGLELEDGKAEVDDLAIIGDSNTFLGIQIHIGKNRIVRRIFEHLGYEVVSLDRVQYAGLTKKDLSRGHWRFLNEKEVVRLKYFL